MDSKADMISQVSIITETILLFKLQFTPHHLKR